MDKHLVDLSLIEKILVKAYATTVMGKVHDIEKDVPIKLKEYVKLEIALREISAINNE